MHVFRRVFYLIIGFTFPGFWVLHASGLMAGLYHPLQRLLQSNATLCPSFISAGCLYLVAIVLFELVRHLAGRLSRE